MSQTESQTQFNADVIIVGAGPIGLALACALRHHGVDCRLLEERTKPSKDSKAHNVWSRPQELLHGIGALDAVAQKAYRIEKINVVLNGNPLDEVAIGGVPSPFPKALYSGQGIIEATLAEVLESRGGQVERGRKVTEIKPDAEGVSVTVVPHAEANDDKGDHDQRHESGQSEEAPSETLRCRFLVGADGVKGTVRKQVGLEFENTPFEGRATRQIDIKLQWERSTDPNQLWFFLYHNGFAGVMPVWGGYHRIFFLEDDALVPDRDPTLEEMQDRAREVIGDPSITISDPIWTSHGRFKHGVAPCYSQGRVFLAGDAGHHTLPIGGQGMNAGFHDSVGLAWRLAMELAGHAGAPILDSYGDERQAAHQDLDEDQAKGFERLMYRGPLQDLAANVAAKTLPNIGSRVFGSDDLQQLSVTYPKSSLSEDHLGVRQLLRSDVPHAGDRAPDAPVTASDGATQSLFSQIYNPDGWTWGWSLLAFDGRKEDAEPLLQAAIEAVAPWEWVRPRLILAAPAAHEAQSGDTARFFDRDGHAHSAYALEGIPALILIRPDGHIAFRGAAGHPEQLQEFCAKTFAAPAKK